jgi:hypothetical protein
MKKILCNASTNPTSMEIVSVFPTSPMGVCEVTSPEERLWQATNANLAGLQRIVSSHFRATCRNYTQIGEGSYARAFLFYLSNGMKVVGRVVLPAATH